MSPPSPADGAHDDRHAKVQADIRARAEVVRELAALSPGESLEYGSRWRAVAVKRTEQREHETDLVIACYDEVDEHRIDRPRSSDPAAIRDAIVHVEILRDELKRHLAGVVLDDQLRRLGLMS